MAQAAKATSASASAGPATGPATDTHRTVYLPIVRDQVPEVLTLFDFPDPEPDHRRTADDHVPAQSLYLMNNPFVITAGGGVGRQAAGQRATMTTATN